MPATIDLQYPCRWRPALPHPEAPDGARFIRWFCSTLELSHNATHRGYHHAMAASGRAAVRVFIGRLIVVSGAALSYNASAVVCDLTEVASWPTMQRVSPHLWRVAAQRGEPDAANRGETTQLVVAREERSSGARIWLIGSGPSPAYGARLACAVKHVVGQAVTDVVNTRAAPELAMGNVAFPQARLWALPDVIASMRARCLMCLERLKSRIGEAGNSLQNEVIRAPEWAVEERHLGPFTWRALPRMKGENLLVLRHLEDRIVIAQGLLWEGDVPDLHEAHVDVIAASLRALEKFAKGARLLGEQGELTAPSTVAQHRRYVAQLRAAVWAQLERGEVQGADGVRGTSAELPEFASLPSYAARHPLHVQRVWRELEPQMFR